MVTPAHFEMFKLKADLHACCRIPLLQRPGLVLAAEQELGITAGLQDRVIQVFGGVVYMDFDRNLMQRSGGIGRWAAPGPVCMRKYTDAR